MRRYSISTFFSTVLLGFGFCLVLCFYALLEYGNLNTTSVREEARVLAVAQTVEALTREDILKGSYDKITTTLNSLFLLPEFGVVIAKSNGEALGASLGRLGREVVRSPLEYRTDPGFLKALQGEQFADSVTNAPRNNVSSQAFVPVVENKEIAAIVVVTTQGRQAPQRSGRLTSILIGAVTVTLVLGLVIALATAKYFSRALNRLRDRSTLLAQPQDLDRRATAIIEIDQLSTNIENLRNSLLTERKRADMERTHETAILASMAEGVLAVNSENELLSLNDSARAILGLGNDHYVGRKVEESIRNYDIQQLIRDVLAGLPGVERELRVFTPRRAELVIHAQALVSAQKETQGAVVVIRDITRLKRLETVHRDFVANVSHELRTPITAIKGFVETLLDLGETDWQIVHKYLTTVNHHANRLHAIIEDLLQLARLERDSMPATLVKETTPIPALVSSALELVAHKAKRKDISIETFVPQELSAWVNASLIEHALINLLDNAIKYSNPGKTIELRADVHSGKLTLEVKDEGFGIPAEHIPRLFERFFVVDKARSRAHGGTGLGLAIVRTIAQAHGGKVSVQSSQETGSTFTLEIPSA